MKKSGLLLVLLLVLVPLASAEVRINEVMPHTNNTFSFEWVELYNDGGDVAIINWKIGDLSGNDTFTLNISSQGFALIIDGISDDCSLFNISSESCFALSNIGSGLNDNSETIFLYNESNDTTDDFSWNNNIKSSGKSWSFGGTEWKQCSPTPSSNNCPSETNEQENNEEEENNDENNQNEIYLDIEWDEKEIYNKDEFYIKIEAFNLGDAKYDLKVWIEFDNNDTLISEIYNSETGEWQNGWYYIDDVLEGPGEDTKNVEMRLEEEFRDYHGDARIFARLKGENDIKDENIEIKDGSKEDDADKAEDNETYSDIEAALKEMKEKKQQEEADEEVIRLGSVPAKAEETENINTVGDVVYQSRQEIIKRYALYGFAVLCAILCILLAYDKLK